jgi:hypothetical protein
MDVRRISAAGIAAFSLAVAAIGPAGATHPTPKPHMRRLIGPTPGPLHLITPAPGLPKPTPTPKTGPQPNNNHKPG